MRFKTVTCALASMLLLALVAQPAQQRQVPAQPSPLPKTHPGSAQPGGKARHPKEEPCWEQAGISKNVLEQRKSIRESTRAQVQGVCSDASLTEQQKRERIREIRRSAREQMMGLLTSQQREELKECQRTRHPAGGMPRAGQPHPNDPCAGMGR
jgi:hypothetical protein